MIFLNSGFNRPRLKGAIDVTVIITKNYLPEGEGDADMFIAKYKEEIDRDIAIA
uniref:Uncharacterized protein n=1 Tax=Candidatus Kentrum sp. FW TaxID=2126338 RepID=A0A450SY85_9GAMM|nr:MAG: hypothetical protein BECKFW1821B_GA0114236_10456 [Candidatus Kentron sp. FW]